MLMFLKKTSNMQKSAVRLIVNARYNEHSEPIFKQTKILPLSELILFFNLQFMQRFTNGFLPCLFSSTWTNNELRRQDHTLHLRNSDDINIPFARLTSSMLQPYVNLPRTWINFNAPTVKIHRERNLFNNKLKTHLLAKLSDNINCTRLLCPSCHLRPNLNAI